jgi:hypothetical protein
MAAISCACASVVVAGLSQITAKPSLQRGLAAGRCMVGRGDRHKINAILALGFLGHHGGDVGIGAGRVDAIRFPAARDFSALLELKAPATSSISRSISAARRCTGPMKDPGPPPIIPMRKRREAMLSRLEYP